MTQVFLNDIAPAVPDHDVHGKFKQFCPRLISDARERRLFSRMADRAQIDHRYSFLQPHPDESEMDTAGFYREHEFPSTEKRMSFYEEHAFALARRALDKLDISESTHLIVTSCTGFYAPGVEQQIMAHYELDPALERSSVGFMGCYASMNALKLARHIVRSESDARVLVLNLELCTLHLKPSGSLEEMLSFLIFADGCAASQISADPHGIVIEGFNSRILPDSEGLITWRIGEMGFDMHLSGKVPTTIAGNLAGTLPTLLDGCPASDIVNWAVHPGGRTVLDGVRDGAGLPEEALADSREVLRRYGNMSSPTIMFVLKAMLDRNEPGPGCAMAFGPGLSVESMRFNLH